MLQYQRQEKLDQAVQVAMQILRSTTASRQSAPASIRRRRRPRGRAARPPPASWPDPAGCPSSSTGPTSSSKKTPNAVQIHQALADYYTAARQPAKARAELVKVVELRPEDVDLRLQVANQLVQEGQAEAAVEQYRAAFKKDPSLLDRVSLDPAPDAFRKAGKLDELLRLLRRVRLRSTASAPTMASSSSRTSRPMMPRQRPGHRRSSASSGSRLPGRSDRTAHLHRARGDLADARDLRRSSARRSFPGPPRRDLVRAVVSVPAAWRCPSAATGRDRSQTAASRLLDLAEARGQLDELAGEIEAARKDRPDWTAGDVYLAMVRCRAGRYDEARALVRKLADPKTQKDRSLDVPSTRCTPAWALGSELEAIPTRLDDLALTVYERARWTIPMPFLQYRFERTAPRPAG